MNNNITPETPKIGYAASDLTNGHNIHAIQYNVDQRLSAPWGGIYLALIGSLFGCVLAINAPTPQRVKSRFEITAGLTMVALAACVVDRAILSTRPKVTERLLNKQNAAAGGELPDIMILCHQYHILKEKIQPMHAPQNSEAFVMAASNYLNGIQAFAKAIDRSINTGSDYERQQLETIIAIRDDNGNWNEQEEQQRTAFLSDMFSHALAMQQGYLIGGNELGELSFFCAEALLRISKGQDIDTDVDRQDIELFRGRTAETMQFTGQTGLKALPQADSELFQNVYDAHQTIVGSGLYIEEGRD